jgi:hypothetical protein
VSDIRNGADPESVQANQLEMAKKNQGVECLGVRSEGALGQAQFKLRSVADRGTHTNDHLN